MKHCINVSNYWLDGTLASGGRGVLRRCGDAIRMSHWLSISPTDVEKRTANQNSSDTRRPVWKLHAVRFREKNKEDKMVAKARERSQSEYFQEHWK